MIRALWRMLLSLAFLPQILSVFALIYCACLFFPASLHAANIPLPGLISSGLIDFNNTSTFPQEDTSRWHFAENRAAGLLSVMQMRLPAAPLATWSVLPTAEPDVHFRVAFRQPVTIGSLFGLDNCTIAILRPGVSYPGRLDNNADWLPLSYNYWVDNSFPVHTLAEQVTTRAIRITRNRQLWPGEVQAETLNCFLISQFRLFNIAPYASCFASRQRGNSPREREYYSPANLTANSKKGIWMAWRQPQNIHEYQESDWITTHFPQPVTPQLIGLVEPFARQIRIDRFTGDSSRHPAVTSSPFWQAIGNGDIIPEWRASTVRFFPLDTSSATTALRITFTQLLSNENPDIVERIRQQGPWPSLNNLLILVDLKHNPLPGLETVTVNPPLALSFNMPFDGLLTLALDRSDSSALTELSITSPRIRNLFSLQHWQAGDHEVRWDGLDDKKIPVLPGNYQIKGIASPKLNLSWQMTPFSNPKLPWSTGDAESTRPQFGQGGFLSDLTAPNSVISVGNQIWLGAEWSINGDSLIRLGLDGTKQLGIKRLSTSGVKALGSDSNTIYAGTDSGFIGEQCVVYKIDPQTGNYSTLLRFNLDPAIGRGGGLKSIVAAKELYLGYNAPALLATDSILTPSVINLDASIPKDMDYTRYGPGGLGSLLRMTGQAPAPYHVITPVGDEQKREILLVFKQPVAITSITMPGRVMPDLTEVAILPDTINNSPSMTTLPANIPASAWQKFTLITHLGVTLAHTNYVGKAIALRLTFELPVTTASNFWQPRLPGFKALRQRMKLVTDGRWTSTSGRLGISPNLWWESRQRAIDAPISPESPESVSIRWPQPTAVSAIQLIDPFAKRILVSGIDATGKRLELGEIAPPLWWRPSYLDAWLDFKKTVKLTSLTLLVVEALTRENIDIERRGGGQADLAAIGGIALLAIDPDAKIEQDLSSRIDVINPQDGKLLRQLPVPGQDLQAMILLPEPAADLLLLDSENVWKIDPETGANQLWLTDLDAKFVNLTVNPASNELAIIDSKTETIRSYNIDAIKTAVQAGQNNTTSIPIIKQLGQVGGLQPGLRNKNAFANLSDLAFDQNGALWLTENDPQLKRVSCWDWSTLQLKQEFFGPAEDSRGWLDPDNANILYYNGLAFNLDQRQNSWQVSQILLRPGFAGLPMRSGLLPSRVITCQGWRYLVSDPAQNTGFAVISKLDTAAGAAIPCAILGTASDWPILSNSEFAHFSSSDLSNASVLWIDSNDNGQVDVDEVSLGPTILFTRMPSLIGDDLSILCGESGAAASRLFRPAGFSRGGTPLYAFNQVERRLPIDQAQSAMLLPDSSVLGIGGAVEKILPAGTSLWEYPDSYPGLRAAELAASPDPLLKFQGGVSVLGLAPHDKLGQLYAVSTAFGNVFLFSQDGLLSGQLFVDSRATSRRWNMPQAVAGMSVNSLSRSNMANLAGSFQYIAADNGKYYLLGGASSLDIMEISGLEQLQPLTGQTFEYTPEAYLSADAWRIMQEWRNLATAEARLLLIPQSQDRNWEQFVSIDIMDQAQVKAVASRSGLRLLFTVKDSTPLSTCAGEDVNLFQRGDAIDIQLGLDSSASQERLHPVSGDIRILAAQVAGRPQAVLYRYKVLHDINDQPVVIHSPWRNLTIDAVERHDEFVVRCEEFAQHYEIELFLPWPTLGVQAPESGAEFRADFGILQSDEDGLTTKSRHYWSSSLPINSGDAVASIRVIPALWGYVLVE